MSLRDTRRPFIPGSVLFVTAGVFAALAAGAGAAAPSSSSVHSDGRVAWWPFETGPWYGDVPAEQRHEPGVLRTRVGSFRTAGDGLALPPQLRRGPGARPSPLGGLYWVVQFDGAVTEAGRSAVLATGAAIVDYLPNHAYVVRLPARAEGLLRALEGVAWVGPFEPAYRIEPTLGALPVPDPENAASRVFTVRVTFFEEEPAAEMAARTRASGGVVTELLEPDHALVAQVAAAAIPAIAALEGVAWIGEIPAYRLWSAESQEVLQGGSVAEGRLFWDAGVHGAGQTVAVMDSGLDVDTTPMANTAADAGTPGAGHRKVVSYRPYGQGDTKTCSGGEGIYVYTHGTNVTQNAVGDRSGLGYDSDVDGVAHRARVVFQDIQPTDFSHCHFGTVTPPASLTAAFTDAYNAGARLHNLSFGGGPPYGSYATDADNFLWDHRDYMIFVAAGNSGAGGLGDPAGLKSGMSIGGSDQDPLQNVRYADSSIGPAPDNRFTPIVVAPATDSSGAAGNPAPNNYATSVYVSDADSNITGTPGNTILQGYSGTSFASPMAMAAAALVRDYLARGYYPSGAANPPDARANPSGVLLKALLLASADHMTCPACGGGRPNSYVGLGRIDLANILPLTGSSRTAPALIIEDYGQATGMKTGQAFERKFRLLGGARPVRAVLAWIDKSGSPLANDLRLTLTGPGKTYNGNNFSGEWSATAAQGGTLNDVSNPQEAVFVAPADAAYGVWTARVEGVSVPWPDSRFGNSQPYALVIGGDLENRWPPEVSGRGAPVQLTQERLDATTQRLTWEHLGDPSLAYNLYRGTLSALRSGQYDHGRINAATCGLTTNTTTLADLQDAVGRYYLVVAISGGGEGSAGRASGGAERPAGNPACP